jgi:hypothetical protein
MVQALTLRAAAGRAAASGYWKTRRFCTANNAAIRCPWAWRVLHIALPDGPHLPPTAPRTHGRVRTKLHQRAGCAGADLDRATLHSHATARGEAGRDLCPRHWARIQACERWRGERNMQTPGDHATNLGATMLVLPQVAPLASSLGKLGTQCI